MRPCGKRFACPARAICHHRLAEVQLLLPDRPLQHEPAGHISPKPPSQDRHYALLATVVSTPSDHFRLTPPTGLAALPDKCEPTCVQYLRPRASSDSGTLSTQDERTPTLVSAPPFLRPVKTDDLSALNTIPQPEHCPRSPPHHFSSSCQSLCLADDDTRRHHRSLPLPNFQDRFERRRHSASKLRKSVMRIPSPPVPAVSDTRSSTSRPPSSTSNLPSWTSTRAMTRITGRKVRMSLQIGRASCRERVS